METYSSYAEYIFDSFKNWCWNNVSLFNFHSLISFVFRNSNIPLSLNARRCSYRISRSTTAKSRIDILKSVKPQIQSEIPAWCCLQMRFTCTRTAKRLELTFTSANSIMNISLHYSRYRQTTKFLKNPKGCHVSNSRVYNYRQTDN